MIEEQSNFLSPLPPIPPQSPVSAKSDGVIDATNGDVCEPVQAYNAPYNNKGGLITKSGTSMSTPLLAGAAALVRQYFIEGLYPAGACATGKKGVGEENVRK